MRSVIFGTLMALTVAWAMAAEAKEDLFSANYMLPGCKAYLAQSPPSGFAGGLCVGTVETLNFMTPTLKRERGCADIPRGVTNDQTVRVVIRYIEARPNRMHESFRLLALEAILNAWPCRN